MPYSAPDLYRMSPATHKRYALILFVVWTLLIVVSTIHTSQTRRQATRDIALAEARMAYHKDMLYRKWATSHGGVYVIVDERTPPNPNLAHLPDRDTTTRSGRQLTLMNPAYMTRQVYEFSQSFSGPRGRLVSDRPLHPQNSPDSWESAALRNFTGDHQEVFTQTRDNGSAQFRYLRAFITEKPCLKCHAQHGYHEGEVRGGISISLPMTELLASETSEIRNLVAWHSAIWLLGAGGLFTGYRRLRFSTELLLQQQQDLQEQNDELTMMEEELRQQVDEYMEVHDELVTEKAKLAQLNTSLEQMVVARTVALRETNERLEQEVEHREAANHEIVMLNDGLQQRAQALEQINYELESFSYSVSHDLRAPLRHINSFSNLLLEDCGSELSSQGHDYLQRICNASNRMGRLIDELLRLSKVSRSELHLVPVNLSDLASDIAASLQEAEPDRQITVTIAPELRVVGDPTLLRQLLENLLGNAWKYAAQTKDAAIVVGTTLDHGSSIFYVRDNGIGFDMAYANKLFGAFQRLHGNEFDGVGIGLAIVQRIISRHNGKIWAQAAPDQGATFFFSLPFTSQH